MDTMRHLALFSTSLAAAIILTSCGSRGGDHDHDHAEVFLDEPVSIEIEVYDPVSGFVWEDVSVRIVEIEHEWSDQINVNTVQNDYFFTDFDGIVFFSPDYLGREDLGFLVDEFEGAILSPDILEDEASVLIEISAPGLGVVFERIDISWEEPRVFVSIPF